MRRGHPRGIRAPEELMKLFRRTRVWQSETDNEAEAIWMKYPRKGGPWIKNIIYGLNDVVAHGVVNPKRIGLNGINLRSLELTWRSLSKTSWLERFKATVFEQRSKDFEEWADARRLKLITDLFHRERALPQYKPIAETFTMTPWEYSSQSTEPDTAKP